MRYRKTTEDKWNECICNTEEVQLNLFEQYPENNSRYYVLDSKAKEYSILRIVELGNYEMINVIFFEQDLSKFIEPFTFLLDKNCNSKIQYIQILHSDINLEKFLCQCGFEKTLHLREHIFIDDRFFDILTYTYEGGKR